MKCANNKKSTDKLFSKKQHASSFKQLAITKRNRAKLEKRC